jgi:hypothetical protein
MLLVSTAKSKNQSYFQHLEHSGHNIYHLPSQRNFAFTLAVHIFFCDSQNKQRFITSIMFGVAQFV